MTMLDEAIARYHRLIEGPTYRDGAWISEIETAMSERQLVNGGRPVCPVLRPHFVTRRQYDGMVKAAEALYSAIDRVRLWAVEDTALMSRMELLPAEKMLAMVDPGYHYFAVTSLLDTNLHNGTFRFLECSVSGPDDVVYSDALAEVFYNARPVKELRRRYKLSKVSGTKKLLHALLSAYKVTGKKKFPRIAIVEFRNPFQTGASHENMVLAERFREAGYPTEVVTPDQLEYRNGILRRGDFAIDLVYRRISAQEFLVRFNLNHPLLRAYRDGAICMVNSFRTEIVQRKSIFALLTDEQIAAKLPAVERKAIAEHIPWTRVVAPGTTTHKGETIDLVEYIRKHRDKLALKPNYPSADLPSYNGWSMEEPAWERAVKSALRGQYVVQERIEPVTAPFPVLNFGQLESRVMEVDIQPHMYLGKVQSCSAHISEATSGFSTLSGIAPAFVLESGRA
jgi:uncharacterized circularly permuted ATP-grasp superfamily protein